jgi:hypothetical protein
MRYIVIGIVLIMVGMMGILSAFGDALDRVRDKDEAIFGYQLGTMKKLEGKTQLEIPIYIYVFHDGKQVWNRARAEDLKTAACDKLHTYVMDGEK